MSTTDHRFSHLPFVDSQRKQLASLIRRHGARRASVSIPSNHSEGQGSGTIKNYIHFLRIAGGSRQELETQWLLAQRLNFAAKSEIQSLLSLSDEVSRLASGLMNSLDPRP